MTTEKHWHFLEVSEWPYEYRDEEGYEYNLLHPDSCAWNIGIYGGETTSERMCGVSEEVRNLGSEKEAFGDPQPGWYAVSHWVETTPFSGSSWSEVTTGVEVVPLNEFANKRTNNE